MAALGILAPLRIVLARHATRARVGLVIPLFVVFLDLLGSSVNVERRFERVDFTGRGVIILGDGFERGPLFIAGPGVVVFREFVAESEQILRELRALFLGGGKFVGHDGGFPEGKMGSMGNRQLPPLWPAL
jgi:hypothetical protein